MSLVLGIDIGYATGYCFIKDSKKFEYGEVNIKQRDEIFPYVLSHSIEAIIDQKRPDLCLIEAYPFQLPYLNTIQIEITGQIKRFLFDQKIPVAIISPTSIKKLVLLKGNAKEGEVKTILYGILNLEYQFELSKKNSIHIFDSFCMAVLADRYMRGVLPKKDHDHITLSTIGEQSWKMGKN